MSVICVNGRDGALANGLYYVMFHVDLLEEINRVCSGVPGAILDILFADEAVVNWTVVALLVVVSLVVVW